MSKLNGIEYVLLYYFYYVHPFEDPIRIPRNKITEIITNYISYVKKDTSSLYPYTHPEDHDFVHELSEKLKEIQPKLGEAIITSGQNEYELTKPDQREDVILYLLFCEHVPYVYYVKYSKPRPIDNEIVEEIKSYGGSSLQRIDSEKFRIKPCNLPEGQVPGIAANYKLHKLTGREYLTLLLLYGNRNTEVGSNLLTALYGSYVNYVKLHYDHYYERPLGENILTSLKSKLKWLAPRLSLLDEFHIEGAHSNRATLFVQPDSFEDRVIRNILYCRTPPNDF